MKKKIQLEKIPMPTIADFKTVAAHSDDWFGWELSPDEIEEHKRTYGFIYKCLADNTSNTSEWLGFDMAIGRNVVTAIFNCTETHLLERKDEVVTIMYPEMGMSPSAQAAFVSMVCKHPQAKNIKELRIVTRSAWFLSDCKSVRVMHIQGKHSDQKKSVFYAPEAQKNQDDKDRLNILRNDPYFDKGKRAIFFNFVKMKKNNHGIYLGEDQDFVYWHNFDSDLYRTDHYTMWYKLNAVLLTNAQCDGLLPMIEQGKTHEEMRAHLRQYEYKAK